VATVDRLHFWHLINGKQLINVAFTSIYSQMRLWSTLSVGASMTKHLTIWKKASSNVRNYRQMYAVSTDIADSDLATPRLQRAARNVVCALAAVIDLPIADAKVLSNASVRFQALVAALHEGR
jgi:hypothetical protein